MTYTSFSPVEGREGIVVVHDSMTGGYLGCMSRETWEQMLTDTGCRCGEREACSDPGCRGPYYDEVEFVLEAMRP